MTALAEGRDSLKRQKEDDEFNIAIGASDSNRLDIDGGNDTYSLTHSLTYLLTHLLTYSLTHLRRSR